MAKKKSNVQIEKIGFWLMVRDVLIASLIHGQFPVALVGFIIMIMIIKMPENDVSKLVFSFFDLNKTYSIGGYLLSGLMALGWFLHSRIQKRMIDKELKRVVDERNKIQELGLGDKLVSSEE